MEGIDAALTEYPQLIIKCLDYRTGRGAHARQAIGEITVTLVRPSGRETTALAQEFDWDWNARALPSHIQAHIDGFKAAMQRQYGDTWLLKEV